MSEFWNKPRGPSAAGRATRKARVDAAEGSYTEDDIRALHVAQNGLCNGCQRPLIGRRSLDHKQPLARGGSHDPSNLQLLCRSCNSSKGDFTMEEWLANSYISPRGDRVRNPKPVKRYWQCQTPTWAKHRE